MMSEKHLHPLHDHHAEALHEADLDHVSGGAGANAEYVCGCGAKFSTRKALADHQKKEGHI